MSPDGGTLSFNRRYQILGPLGTGGMGVVYRAYDRLAGQVVALKRVIPPEEAEGSTASAGSALSDSSTHLRVALAQEFKLLASLRHPNIIGVLDYGFENDQPYFTMELLENARTILDVGQGESLDVQVGLVVQTLQALTYLHRRGMLHRDLKPSNVLVINDQVKVLDFGLSTMREQHQDPAGRMAGTLAYMAPELLMSEPPSESSDLYAVGVIAYELLAGRHPFDAGDVTSLINDVLTRNPDLDTVKLDHRIGGVLRRLLAKEPQIRYTKASHVIIDLCDAVGLNIPLETAATRESFLQAARLVGRERELASLSEALAGAMRGQGSAWLIGGESGVGKSRLVEELRVLSLVQGALVLRGQAVSVGSSPYQIWRGALRWLALTSDLTDKDASLLKVQIPDVATLLGREIPDPPELDPQTMQNQLLGLTKNMLRAEEQPVVIILEDVHWAGSESLAMLAHLSRIVAGLPVLIIGTYRDDERPDLPSQLPGMADMPLSRLKSHQIAELSEAMLGEAGREHAVVELLQRETEGNVFFLVEVVRALAEEVGMLDLIGKLTLPGRVFAGGMRRIVARRLNRIQPQDRALLQMAALSGRELSLDIVRALAPKVDLDLWLLACADAAVLEVNDGTWRFAHDKLREGALFDLPDKQRSEIHRQIAEVIEHLYPGVPEQTAALAHHWGMAGDTAREAHYAAAAGEQALRSGAFREALAFAGRALTLLGRQSADPEALRKRVALKRLLAESYLGLGQYGEAGKELQESYTLCQQIDDSHGMAECLHSLGSVAYATEVYEQAERYYAESLNFFRQAGDRTGITRALNSLGNVAYELGDDKKAMRLYQESLALSREIGNQWGMAGSLRGSEEQVE